MILYKDLNVIRNYLAILGTPKIYHQSFCFTRIEKGVCRVYDDEGLVGQSKEMMGLVLVLVEVAGI